MDSFRPERTRVSSMATLQNLLTPKAWPKQILLSSPNGLCILSIALLFTPPSANNVLPRVCQARPVPRGSVQMPCLHETILGDPAEERYPGFSRPKK